MALVCLLLFAVVSLIYWRAFAFVVHGFVSLAISQETGWN